MPLDSVAVRTRVDTLASDAVSPATYDAARPWYRPYVMALKERRRMPLGPHATVLFENHETALYQIHEVLRAEGRSSLRLARELAEYAQLVPTAGEFRATLFVDSSCASTGRALARRCAQPGGLVLTAGPECVDSVAVDLDGEDSDPVRYLAFRTTLHLRTALRAGFSRPTLSLGNDQYQLPSALCAELRADLAMQLPRTRLHHPTHPTD